MNSLQSTYSVHASSSQFPNVSSSLKSTQVDMPLSSRVESSRMCSSRPPSTWSHFSLKSGHVSVPQRLPGLILNPQLSVRKWQFTAPPTFLTPSAADCTNCCYTVIAVWIIFSIWLCSSMCCIENNLYWFICCWYKPCYQLLSVAVSVVI